MLLAAALAASGSVRAADDKPSDAKVLKTEDGLRFQLPADWPIEKRNGILGPIPIEEYIARKFSALNNRVQELERQQTSLDLKLRVLEEQLKKSRLQSGGSNAP